MTHGDALSKETRMYWILSTALKTAERCDDLVEQAECRDELDVMANYTGSPRLRALCTAAVRGPADNETMATIA